MQGHKKSQSSSIGMKGLYVTLKWHKSFQLVILVELANWPVIIHNHAQDAWSEVARWDVCITVSH